MKALEKAAKDRLDARTEPVAAEPAVTASAAPAAKSDLTLEPLTAEAPAPPARPAPAPSRPAPAPRSSSPSSSSSSSSLASSREQATAATVLQAGGAARGGGPGYVRQHPIMVFAGIAALIAIGFGSYVYLQIFHPGLFVKQSPVTPRQPPPPPFSQAPAPGPAIAAVPGAVPGTAQGSATASAATPLPPATPSLQESLAEPVPPPPPAPPPAPAREKPAAAEAAPAPTAPAPRNTIVVSRGSGAPSVSPLMTEAYAAFQANRLEAAQRTYEQLLRAEPRNMEALLGLAAIATLEGRNDEAIRRHLQVLEVEPRNALAQSGLIGLLGRADPLAAEARLKQLIAREPSAFLYFTLGNLYADQSHWAPAQQAYFQAFHLEPGNPDFAYNLAVGLEHVSQPKLALGFYRRAVQLAGTPERARFNVALAQERISKLASQVE